MQPILDIRPIRTDRFTYSLGAARQSGRPCEDLFETIDSCLHDAGEALATYFERVQIFYAGIPLGTHAVARLLYDPLGLLQELKRRLVAIYRVRSARWAPAAGRFARRAGKRKSPRAQDRRARAATNNIARPWPAVPCRPASQARAVAAETAARPCCSGAAKIEGSQVARSRG